MVVRTFVESIGGIGERRGQTCSGFVWTRWLLSQNRWRLRANNWRTNFNFFHSCRWWIISMQYFMVPHGQIVGKLVGPISIQKMARVYQLLQNEACDVEFGFTLSWPTWPCSLILFFSLNLAAFTSMLITSAIITNFLC